MTPQLLKEIMLPVVESLAERFRDLEARVATLEPPEPTELLVWPPIDLGPVTGTDPDQRYWNG